MKKYIVSGMSCAACCTRVEKAVSKVEGVSSCSVNLLTNTLAVEGNALESDIISAVDKAGYGIALENKSDTSSYDVLKDKTTPILKKRFVYSVVFLVILMYFSMGHIMWGFPVPDFLNGNYPAIGIIQFVLTVVIIIINKKFFENGFKSLFKGSPNMDTLVALGSGAAFVYSTYILFLVTDACIKGNTALGASLMHEFYFESAAMILTLITVGKILESHSKGKTTNALKSLLSLSPKTAVIIENGAEKTVPVSYLKTGDVFVVRPGESIPTDGEILEGSTAVDESALTGESIPVDKATGDSVCAATLNTSGYIRCRATRVGEDTTLSQIIKLVSDTAATKAPVAKAADKVSGIFVPVVIAIAFITVLIWLLTGESAGFALARGISVLVISCPCALGLATPVAIMVGSGVGAKNGVLFKSAVSLEAAGKTQIVALDKTGTVTSGNPIVTDIIACGEYTEDLLLKLAVSLESKSEHPLSKAIISKAKEKGISAFDVTDFEISAGNGLSAKYDGKKLAGGKELFIEKNYDIPEELKIKAEILSKSGKTPLYFAYDCETAGIIAVADVIKADSAKAVSKLKNMGIRVVMITGDNKMAAKSIGDAAGVDEVVSNVLPDGKAQVISELKKSGKVTMVGDGINDAPALTLADTGIAIGAGTDVAINSADIVLMKSRLSDVVSAIRLSRATLKNIYENLFWAFIYNVIGIPIAAGVLIPSYGLKLNPMIAAAAMSLSSFCVVTNALRLNFVNLKSAKYDRKIKQKSKKELYKMTVTMKIEGMMCPHCENRVKNALEAIDGVDTAEVSFSSDSASLMLSKNIDDGVLKNAVENEGYKVMQIMR